MRRSQLILEEEQFETLKAVASRRGRSISSVLREIVAEYISGTLAPARASGLRRIEGVGEDPGSAAVEHDRFLYGGEGGSPRPARRARRSG
ncbi:MAG: hypothetical protein HY608_03415 [Planctomycetes bacterium]|nr:hypothetical protein [Planctomycetota bacterium]